MLGPITDSGSPSLYPKSVTTVSDVAGIGAPITRMLFLGHSNVMAYTTSILVVNLLRFECFKNKKN